MLNLRWRAWLWFALLWLASVAALATIAYLLRMLMKFGVYS